MGKIINIIKEKKFKFICFFWIVISIQFVMGGRLQTTGFIANNILEIIIDIFKIIGLSVIFIVLHYCSLELINKIKKIDQNKEKKECKNILKKDRWIIYFFIIIICWIPVLLAFYPCCIDYDGGYQIHNYYFFNNMQHHPILITKLYTLFYVIGLKINSPTIGMYIFSICQMTFMALTFSYCVKFIEDETNNEWIRNISIIFYALYPYNQLFSIMTTKDVIFAGLFLIFIISLYKMLKDNYKIGDYIFIIIIGFVMLFSRNNAFYTIIVSLPFILLILKNSKKQIKQVLIVFLTIVVSYKCLNNLLYKNTTININKSTQIVEKKASNDEGSMRLAFFSQAVGKISKDKEGELTEYEKEKIKYYFTDYKKMRQEYFGNIADKSLGNTKCSIVGKEKKDFFKFMLELFKKYPTTFIESYLNTTRGYWYINDNSFCNITMYKHVGAIELYGYEIGTGKYKVVLDSKFPILKSFYKYMFCNNAYRNIPVLYVFFQPGIYFYIVLAFLLYEIYKKELCKLVVAVFMFVFYASCYMANCSIVRYIYPIIVCMPFIMGLVINNEKDIINEHERKK